MFPVVNKPVEVIELPNIKPETSNLVPTVAVNLPIATLLSASAVPTLVLIKLSLPSPLTLKVFANPDSFITIPPAITFNAVVI